jgi:hypothetical protein
VLCFLFHHHATQPPPNSSPGEQQPQQQRVYKKVNKRVNKKGKIIPRTHNILFEPTETLAKNTKKTKTPNARKKMLRPPVESRF